MDNHSCCDCLSNVLILTFDNVCKLKIIQENAFSQASFSTLSRLCMTHK